MVREFNTDSKGNRFSDETIDKVWNKGTPIKGESDRRKKDCCGAEIWRTLYGNTTQHGWEIDHIKPVTTIEINALIFNHRDFCLSKLISLK